MKILALDTSTKVAGSAIADESGLLAESWLNTGKTHSQRFLSLVDNMLKNSDLTLDDMDGFAVTVGPGSFTGLRIGIATVKGFAQVLGKPITGIVTLDALAQNLVGIQGYICPILDARKNEVYTALYRGESELERLSDYYALSPVDLLKDLKGKKEPVTFLGDAVPVYRHLFEEVLGDRASFAPLSRNLLRAAEVAFLGLKKLKQREIVNVYEIKPLYLRKSEAEINWEKIHGGCCGD